MKNLPRGVVGRSGLDVPPFLMDVKDWAIGVVGRERFGFVDELSTPESLETLLGSTLLSDILRGSTGNSLAAIIRVGDALMRSLAICAYSGSLGKTGVFMYVKDCESSHSDSVSSAGVNA